jgi:hypothetical protein
MTYRSYETAIKGKDGLPLYGLDAELNAKMEAKYDREKEAEVMNWIQAVTGKPFPNRNDFAGSLKDGTLLCDLANKISPGIIPKVNRGKLAFMKMENIGYFLQAAEKLGLQTHDSFRTVDLYEEKNIPQVIQALYIFGSVAQKIPSYHGPVIGVKLADKKEIHFSEEQLRASKNTVGQQYASSIKVDTGRSIAREVVKVNEVGDKSAVSMQSQASIKHDTGRSISREVVKVQDTGSRGAVSQQNAASIKVDTGRSISNHPVKIQSNNSGNLSELEKLADLRNKGIITEEEFTQKKKQILGL